MTTLLVARPAVLGEDAGMLSELSDPGNMVLTLLWFAAAVGWAIWRLLARRGKPGEQDRTSAADEGEGQGWWPSRGAGIVEVALLATVVLVFLSTTVAAYKHPARLIAWEWLGLFAAFFVVRRLAARPADQQALMTVLLATGIALSAHGVYQEAVELPRFRRAFTEDRPLNAAAALFMQNSPLGFAALSSYAASLSDSREALRAALAAQGLYLEPDDPALALLRRRALDNHVFGTYAHPNSFAGVLALLLPGLAGAAWFAFRARSPRWRTSLVVGCFLLGGAALLLTHSRGALLALVLVGGVVLAVGGWPIWRRHRLAVAVVLLALGGAAYGMYAGGLLTAGMGKESRTAAFRLDYWRLTWRIIAGSPWLGVGPGNFGPAYTRVMDESAEEPIKDPHDFALEMWATSGVFALLALLTALGAFFLVVGRGWRVVGQEEGSPPKAEAEPPLRWEYYVGGMFGLVLGFVLRVGEGQAGDLVAEAMAAGVRSVAWFGAFALLETIPWTARGRALALAAGAAALLLNLTVSGSINFPSVAGPLWVVMALALAAVTPRDEAEQAPSPEGGASPVARLLPLPVFAALALAYLVYAFTPVVTGQKYLRNGQEAGQRMVEQIARNPNATFLRPFALFREKVIAPLEEAAKEDPDDARIQVARAFWYGELWQLELMAGIDHRDAVKVAQKAVEAAVRAQQLDPREARGFLAEYRLHDRFAEILHLAARKQTDKERKDELQKQVREEYRRAAQALARHVPDDPGNPALRYRIAVALFQAGDEAEARDAAETALDLDSRQKGLARRLTDPQRKELRQRLGLPEGR